MDTLIVFLSQFSCVYLLGIQSLNVRDSRYVGAAITSTLLGISGFTSTSIIGGKEIEDLWTVLGLSFVVAGPLAITLAMHTHSKIFKER